MHERDEKRVPERLRGRVGNRASVCAAVLDRDELDDLTPFFFPLGVTPARGVACSLNQKNTRLNSRTNKPTQPHTPQASFHYTPWPPPLL